MVTIAVGLIVAAIMLIIYYFSSRDIFSVLGTISIIAAFIISLMPIGLAYGDWHLIEERELISLSNETASEGKREIYLLSTANNGYKYRYSIESSKAYKTDILWSNNVEVNEEVNCKTPILKIYEKEGVRSVWTFIVFPAQTKYVFHIPEGSVSNM